jgi:hypothetical protein
MTEATTRSLFTIRNKFGTKNERELDWIEEADNLVKTTANVIRNTVGMATGLISDNENLNYTMALYNIMFEIRNPTETSEFLRDNKYLIPLVSEAYHKLQDFFPPSPLFMEVSHNEMVISVGTSLSPNEAKRNLDEFDEKWWLDKCTESNAKLCITVEFQ